ncbi:hypothetical protein BsWGS_06805 [Bradybaena similaris]
MYSSLPNIKRPFFSDGLPDSWNSGEDQNNSGDGFPDSKRKRRSRWSTNPEDKTVIPGMPTVIPSNLTESQQRQYVVHLQIEEITRKLRTGDLGIPANPEQRSPSPEPIYNNEGKRMNTREYRTRKKLEEDRHKLIQEALKLNPDFKPPADYKPPIIRVNDKVMIPQEEHPEINFVGLLIGPRGNTLKNLEKETGAKIIIRGKGSVKDGKIGRKDGQPLPGEDEPLHAYVTANNPENVTKAVDKIKEIIRQGIEVPEGQNDLRRQQLRELALLNGTLRENDGLNKLRQIAESQTIITNTIVCTICGGAGHIAQDCKQKRPGDSFRTQQTQNPAERAKMDSEYMSLMAELGEGPPPKTEQSTFSAPNPPNYGRTLLSNPPPNPMAINSPWQMNTRPPVAHHVPGVPLLTRPSYGMLMGPPQINPLGRLTMHSTTQPPPGMQAPSGYSAQMTTSQAQQQSPLLGGMGTVPQLQQSPDLGGSWQQPPAQSPQTSSAQSMTSIGSQGETNPSSMSVPPPPPPPPASLLPPPPPPFLGSTLLQASSSSSSWGQQTPTGKAPLLSSPQPPPPPPASGRDGESALTAQQQALLDIQNQVLQKQQQKVAMLTQSARMGDMTSSGMAMMMNRDSQLNSATGGLENASSSFNRPQSMRTGPDSSFNHPQSTRAVSDSSLNHPQTTRAVADSSFNQPQSMRTGPDSSFSSQNNQSMMMNNQNLHKSGMFEDKGQPYTLNQTSPQGNIMNSDGLRGQMTNRNFDNHFNYHQMSGSDSQGGGHYASMGMGQGSGAQNMSQGNNQSLMSSGNNQQNMMNQRYIPQNMMDQGSMHQSMMNQGNNQNMSQRNSQNMMTQGSNHQSMMSQGSNHQSLMSQGSNHQSLMSQGSASQNNFMGVTNSQNVMSQRSDSSTMNQGNHPRTWNNQSNSNMENNQMENVKNSSMWN